MEAIEKKSNECIDLSNIDESDNLRTVLRFCSNDLKGEMKFCTQITKNLSNIFQKNKNEQLNLKPFKEELEEVVKAILLALSPWHGHQYQKDILECLLQFPTDILSILIIQNSREFVAMLNNIIFTDEINCVDSALINVTAEICYKCLKCASPENRKQFVETNLSLWFSHLIPLLFSCQQLNSMKLLDLTEIILPDIITLDYTNSPHWNTLTKEIFTVDKYPTFMKQMLEANNPAWYRVWIILTKLLGKLLHKAGGPINSFLTVLETAFKGNSDERCRAFRCWRVLADNIALDPSALFVQKRIRFLAVPLKVNNAKTEPVALTKFDTWWHIIKLLAPKITEYYPVIVAPFLSFCFGQPNYPNDANLLVPGYHFRKVQILAIQAFTEIVGHVDCDGCVTMNFERLENPILSPSLISNGANWDHILSCMKQYLIAACKNQSGLVNIHLMTACTWKSCVKHCFLCPNEDFKKRAMDGLCEVVRDISKELENSEVFVKLLVRCLVPSVFSIAGNDVFKNKDMVTSFVKILPTIIDIVISNPENSITSLTELTILQDALQDDNINVADKYLELLIYYLTDKKLLPICSSRSNEDNEKNWLVTASKLVICALRKVQKRSDNMNKVMQDLSNRIKYFKENNPKKYKKEVAILLNELVNEIERPSAEVNSINIVPDPISLRKSKSIKDKESDIATPKTINKSKPKSASKICKVMIEGNEEVTVVNSNWEFNPNKLTEHQKDVLQKKREDIPALYQDLSQSQDASLKAWKSPGYKSDSQDASISNSTETSNSENKKILKDIPNPEVLPNIMKTWFKEKPVNKTPEIDVTNKSDTDCLNGSTDSREKAKENSPIVKIVRLDSTAAKPTESSRLSLKDKIHRNVQNILTSHKSDVCSVPNEKADILIVDSDKNPENDKILNSISSVERPKRQIRQPKKFDADTVEVNIFNRRKTINTVPCIDNIIPKSHLDDSKVIAIIEAKPILNDSVDDINYSDKETKKPPSAQGKIAESKSTFEDTQKANNSTTSLFKEAYQNLSPNTAIDNETNTQKPKKIARLEKKLQIDMVEDMFKPKTKTRKSLIQDTPKRRTLTLDKRSESPNDTAAKARKSLGKMDQNSDDSKEVLEEVKISPRAKLSKSGSPEVSIKDYALQTNQKTPLHTKIATESLKKVDSDEKCKVNKDGNVLVDTSEPLNTTSICSESIFSEDVIESSQDSSISAITVRSIKQNVSRPQPNKLKTYESIDLTNDDDCTELEKGSKEKINDTKTISELGDKTISEMNTQPANDSPNNIEVTEEENLETQLPVEVIEADVIVAEADTLPIDNVSNTENLLDCFEEYQKEKVSTADTSIISSYGNEDEERKKEFNNDTMNLSPIRVEKAERVEEKEPSDDFKEEYSIISLQPTSDDDNDSFEKSLSPEMFTNDNVSPEKMDQSPPRDELAKIMTSPSCLKKKVKQGGRGAQMLGMCIPDKFPQKLLTEKFDTDEVKQPTTGVFAKRNLRVLYHSNNAHEPSKKTSNEIFLELTKEVPPFSSSPSGPILKRKFSEVMDDSTVSPATKKKRVSFHNPPVSTTVSVHKYIEETGIRSPSSLKLKDKNNRTYVAKSLVKKLENEYRADEAMNTNSCETLEASNDLASLESCPTLEIIKHHELNDTDPISKDLIDCCEPISVIASELSSPLMKDLLIDEWKGRIETVGDLAKMTELEVNRLSLKAPKVETVRRTLENYYESLKRVQVACGKTGDGLQRDELENSITDGSREETALASSSHPPAEEPILKEITDKNTQVTRNVLSEMSSCEDVIKYIEQNYSKAQKLKICCELIQSIVPEDE